MTNTTNYDNFRHLFPIYDLGDRPHRTADQLKKNVEEVIESGGDVPFLAFVFGPNMNLRVEYNKYDSDLHRGIVSHGLMELIRRGADHILIVAEVWFRTGETPDWHGVMVLEARPDGDTMHDAEFEGKTALGPWKESRPDKEGNLSRLFERAESTVF